MNQVVPLPAGYTSPAPVTSVEATVLFDGMAPTAQAIADATTRFGLGGTVTHEQSGPACTSDVNGFACLAAPHADLPTEQRDQANGAARHDLRWPDAAAVAGQARSCVTVRVRARERAAFDPYELWGIAHALAAAIASLPGGSAVVFGPGHSFNHPQRVSSTVQPMFSGTVPTDVWFALHATRAHDGTTVLTTQGLSAFGSADVEILGSEAGFAAQAQMMQAALYDIVARLRQAASDAPRPGDQFTSSDGDQATVAGLIRSRAQIEGIEPGNVYQLRYRNEAALDAALTRPDGGASDPSPSEPRPTPPGGFTGATALEHPDQRPDRQHPAIAGASTPTEAARGLVLLSGPIDLTQVGETLAPRGFEITRIEGPELDAHAGAFDVVAVGYPGVVPDAMWTVQPPQQTCLGQNNPANACYVFVEVRGREGGHGQLKHQQRALAHTLAAIAQRPQALAVVLEHEANAIPPHAYVQAADNA